MAQPMLDLVLFQIPRRNKDKIVDCLVNIQQFMQFKEQGESNSVCLHADGLNMLLVMVLILDTDRFHKLLSIAECHDFVLLICAKQYRNRELSNSAQYSTLVRILDDKSSNESCISLISS